MKTLLLAATAILAPLSAAATEIGVSRCNGAVVGANQYGSGLLLSTPTQRIFYPVGAMGLSDTAVYSEQQAMAWVAANVDWAAGARLVDYRDHICGFPMDDEDEDEIESRPTSDDDDGGYTPPPAGSPALF